MRLQARLQRYVGDAMGVVNFQSRERQDGRDGCSQYGGTEPRLLEHRTPEDPSAYMTKVDITEKTLVTDHDFTALVTGIHINRSNDSYDHVDLEDQLWAMFVREHGSAFREFILESAMVNRRYGMQCDVNAYGTFKTEVVIYSGLK